MKYSLFTVIEDKINELSPTVLLGIWFSLLLLFSLFRTSIQVDEARYLSVAWEMGAREDYWVPHLNGEPYSHKGPLLFWITNILWSVTGPYLWVARLIPIFFVMLTAWMIIPLTKSIFPEEPSLPQTVQKIFMCHFAILTISLLYMFDTFMIFWVTWGAFLIYSRKSSIQDSLLLGIVMGLAILTKGPVIFIYLLPLMILKHYILGDEKLSLLKNGLSISIALLIGLAWALPAAYKGGETYAQTLLWAQTANRLINSPFHHRPWWFYAIIFPLFLMPFLFLIRKNWFQKKLLVSLWKNPPSRLLILWIGSIIILFSLMSCKQPQYILPLLPFLCIVMGKFYESTSPSRASPTITKLWILALLFWGGILPFLNNLIEKRLPLITLSDYLNKKENHYRPLACMNSKYHGEFGFLTHQSKIDHLLNIDDLDPWFAKNPHGLVTAFIPEDEWKHYNKYQASHYQHLYAKKGRHNYFIIMERGKVVGPVGLEPTTTPL